MNQEHQSLCLWPPVLLGIVFPHYSFSQGRAQNHFLSGRYSHIGCCLFIIISQSRFEGRFSHEILTGILRLSQKIRSDDGKGFLVILRTLCKTCSPICRKPGFTSIGYNPGSYLSVNKGLNFAKANGTVMISLPTRLIDGEGLFYLQLKFFRRGKKKEYSFFYSVLEMH